MKLETDQLFFLWDALEAFKPDYQDPTAWPNEKRKEELKAMIEEELERRANAPVTVEV